MSCYTNNKKKQSSTLPPPCYHCKPPPFYCPDNGCLLPLEPRLPTYYHDLSSCPPLTCKRKPEPLPLPPTICIAGPCSQPSAPKSYYCPSAPKILPPSSCVRFCIRNTNEGSSCYPCYWSTLPKCPSNIC
ncbi:small proline-rich protein 2B-like [Monomorium pharaonis]|uniref:small proline-rich protein 2B-like n=1 Tax=Monomorium pharaonis TaxID=307658 RepID=UPI001745FFD3|nr:small proline-rich protein 2B-like [Monomorium pharaonis]